MSADLAQLISEMSPWSLRLYKEQLRQKTKSMSPEDRRSYLARIKDIPELGDIVGEFGIQPGEVPSPLKPFEAPPLEMELWKKGLHYLTSPFQWVQEQAIEPFAATITAPFSPTVGEARPGESWLAREKREYKEWEAPWGVKFAVETLPWFAIPTAGGLVGRLGSIAAKGGALARAAATGAKILAPAAAVEKAMAYPIAKPLQVIAQKVLPKPIAIPKAGQLLPNLQPVEEVIEIATRPSVWRNLVNASVRGRKPLAWLGKVLGGQMAVADNPAKLAIGANRIMRFEGMNKASAAVATLERLGTSQRLFDLGEDQLIRSGTLKGTHINTLCTYPKKYAEHLTQEANAWLEQHSALSKAIGELADRNGIERRLLHFEEGGEWAGRRIMGKIDADNRLIEVAYIGARQPARPGMKLPMQKTRVFKTAEEGVAEGFRYFPQEEATFYNMTGLYNTIANKQWGDWFLSKVPYRTVAVTGMPAIARAEMREIQGALKQIEGLAVRLKNNEAIPGQMLKGIKEYYPQEYQQIRLLIKQGKAVDPKVTDDLLKFVRGQQKFYQKEWRETAGFFKEARASAVRPGFTGTMAPDIPAFAGKVFTSPEAKEYINIIRRELNPGFNSALGALNQVNAVGRFFALAGDMSPFGIQLIFLAGANPAIYGKTIYGFVRAMFDPQYSANFIAKHIETIQRNPGLIVSRGGVTEATEAFAKSGWMRGPLRLMGKPLTPFMRGYEAALDTAGIYLAESFEYLATTAARRADMNAFVNEFRGLASYQRLALSSTQSQIERALILANQYNRAIGALMTDIARGGLRGQLARESLTKSVAAIMAMAVAVSYALGETEDEMKDHLNPLSYNFMTWDIMGQRIGPGSKVRSVMATLGKIIKKPEDAAYFAGQFLRGNFSPGVRTGYDLITGKDYIGDPTREGLPSLTKTIIGENMVPIWVQAVAYEGGTIRQRIDRGLVEFLGGRAYPMGAYGEVQALQDKLAQEKYGMSWQELGASPQYGRLYQQRLTRESPELQALSEKAKLESEKWARGEQLVRNEYMSKLDGINQTVNKELDIASKQFDQTRDGRHFRDRVNRAFWLKSQMRNELLESEEFQLIKQTYAQPLTAEQIARISPQDLAYREYNQTMYAPEMYDEFGEYRFDEADRRREEFVRKYGQDVVNYIEQMLGESRVDEPQALQYLRQARQILRPYWDIENQVWAQYPPELRQISDQIRLLEQTDPRQAKWALMRYPKILYVRRLIAMYRKQIRMSNPAIDQALSVFY